MKALVRPCARLRSKADSGLGLESQRQRLTAYCMMRGLDVVEVFEDAAILREGLSPPTRGSKCCKLFAPRLPTPWYPEVGPRLQEHNRLPPDCRSLDTQRIALHIVDLVQCGLTPHRRPGCSC